MAAQGMDTHGEAALVLSYQPRSVLDAGCGTGRVAIEVARHGVDVVGVDVDASMLRVAESRAPGLQWIPADLATLDLERVFDVVVMAGNVPLFCPPAARSALVQACAAHVAPGGKMVAGFQLQQDYDLADYDAVCALEGLELVHRWSTWDRQPFGADPTYAVSVHQRPGDRR